MKVEAEFFENEIVFHGLGIRISAPYVGAVKATVEGREVQIPTVFLSLLLSCEEGERAYELLKATLQFNTAARSHLLRLVVDKGFEVAWAKLRRLEGLKPRGPTLYRCVYEDFKPNAGELIITDGSNTVLFYYSNDVKAEVEKLPLNAYVEEREALNAHRYWKRPHITNNIFEVIRSNLEEFFKFMLRLTRLGTLTSNRFNKIFNAYFEDAREAFKLLKEAEKDEKFRRKRGEFWSRLSVEAVKVEGGYLTRYGFDKVAFISEDGKIYRIGVRKQSILGGRDYVEDSQAREIAYRAYCAGKPPKQLIPNPDLGLWELKEVVEKVGKLNPSLALVLSP